MDPMNPTADNEVVEYLKQRDQRRRRTLIVALVVAFAGIMFGRNMWLDHQHQQEVDRFHKRQVCVFSGRSDC